MIPLGMPGDSQNAPVDGNIPCPCDLDSAEEDS